MNFQSMYLWGFFVVAMVAAVLHRVGSFIKRGSAWRHVQNALLYAFVQCGISFAFVGCYVLYVKNGFSVSPSRLGVAFFFVSVIAFAALWRWKVFDCSPWSLAAPMVYSLFLLASCRAGVFRALLYNPVYGFIGAEAPFPLSAVAALLPFAAAAVGRGVALIDKKKRV